MKTSILFIFLFFSSLIACPTGGPELYIDVRDNENKTWRIYAQKVGDSPVYDENFDVTSEFDYVSSSFEVTANVTTSCEGFDWIADWQAADNTYNEDLGYGIYRISVYKDTGEESKI